MFNVTGWGQYRTQVWLLANRKNNAWDKYWWKRKSCIILEDSCLGRSWTNVLSPFPNCWLGNKGFKGSVCVGGGLQGVWATLHNSWIGCSRGKVSGIINPLVLTSLVSTCLWSGVFIWWGSASHKNNLRMCVRPLSMSFR